MSARSRGSWLAALLMCVSSAAGAHRFHAGITDITFNPRTGSTEIVHTYMAHDVEALLANLYQRQFDLTQEEDARVLQRYLDKQFYIEGAGQARLPLRWVGLTVDAENVVIFQEIENTPLSASVRIHNEVLTDFIPDQSNTVNLKDRATIRSFAFDSKTPSVNTR